MRRSLSFCAVLFGAALVVGGFATGVAAQTSGKEPVITNAPRRIAFDTDVVVVGRLDGGTPGDELTLQRRKNGVWEKVATKSTNERDKARYTLRHLRRSSDVRLKYVDPTTGTVTESAIRRIRVIPRMTIKLSSRHVMHRRAVTVSGRVLPEVSGRRVKIQQRVDGEWRYVDTAYVTSGRFAVRFKARHLGYRRVRAVFDGDDTNTSRWRATAMRVYRPAPATWYGPGLYGNRTACGQTLRSGMLGVAHRTKRCGTKVAVLYRGRTIVVPVIDRGPYSHADWDLTEKTAERLRFSGTDTIGVDPSP